MSPINKHRYDSGQALLLVLLAMAAITTLSLSIVARSITQVGVTNQGDEVLRAYSAAEAGVDKSLTNIPIGSTSQETLTVPTSGGGTSDVGSYSTVVSAFPDDPTEYVYPYELWGGESGAVWLATQNLDGNGVLDCGAGNNQGPCYSGNSFRVCWGNPGASEKPALIVDMIYQASGKRYGKKTLAFDSVSRGNNFFAPTGGACTVGGTNFAHFADIDLSSLPFQSVKLVRVRMLYNNTVPQKFAVQGADFPPQGKKVSSLGKSGSSQIKIEAYLLNPTAPSIMGGLGIFSKNNFSK